MKFSPSPDRRQVNVITAILFAISAVLYVFSLIGITSPLPLQLIAVTALCAGVYIRIRYLYTVINYIICPSCDRVCDEYGNDLYSIPPRLVDFRVAMAQGKRALTTECMLSLDVLTEIVDVTPNGSLDTLRKKYSGLKIYNYTLSLFRTSKRALIFDDDGTFFCIVIEPEEKMVSYLTYITDKNKNS